MELINTDELPNVFGTPEKIPPSNEVTINANSYRTRETVHLTIDGQTEMWHIVKGGLGINTKGDQKNLKGLTYEVLFNPLSREWLKAVPPETMQRSDEGLAYRLKRSVPFAKEALKVAGLPDIAEQLSLCKVKIYGIKVDAFISPHIGPSIEYYLRILSQNKEPLSPSAKSFLSKVYQIAFNQALELYLEHNIWVSDPNPGNILMHFGPDNIHVVLIDFANKTQMAQTSFADSPPEQKSRQLIKKMDQLYEKFRIQSNLHGLPFIEYPDQYYKDIAAKQFPDSI